MPDSHRFDRLSALIVQDSIFRSPGWSGRLAEIDSGFVLLRFRDGLADLMQCSSHFDFSVAIVDKTVFDDTASSEGIPPRMRLNLRPIARVEDGETDAEMERLLMLGCCGFVSDRISRPSFGRTLRAVADAQIAAPRRLLSGLLQRLLAGAAAPKLTNREIEVLESLGRGLSNKRIAEQLFISGETLRWHLRNLYAKTELTTREEIVQYARARYSAPAAEDSTERPRAYAAAGPGE